MLNRVLKTLSADAYDRYVPTHITKLKHALGESTESAVNIIPHINETIFASVGQLIFGADIEISHIRHLVEGNLSVNPIIVLSSKVIPDWIKKKFAKYALITTCYLLDSTFFKQC